MAEKRRVPSNPTRRPTGRRGLPGGPGPHGHPPFNLSREWVAELRDTSRPGRTEQAMALVSKALEAFAAEDYRRAASLAEEAKGHASRSGRVRETLGLALYHSDRWQDALRELLTFRRLTGSVGQNHVIADCYRALGRPERALEVCGEVSPDALPPELWAEVVIVGASALADQGEVVRALAHLALADLEPRQVEPQHLRLWYVRADLLERAGRGQEAQAVWWRIFNEDPEFFDVGERVRAR